MVSKGDFIYRGDHLICPHGKLIRRSAFMRRDRATSMWRIRKTANPVLSEPGACHPTRNEGMWPCVYHPLLLRVRERNQTAEYRRKRKRRKTIAEGTFASLDRPGWARSRLRGLWKVDCEGYMAGLAHNVLNAVCRLRDDAGPTGPLEPRAMDPVLLAGPKASPKESRMPANPAQLHGISTTGGPHMKVVSTL